MIDYLIFEKINPVKDLFRFLNKLDINIFNGVNSLAGRYPILDSLAIFFAKRFDYLLFFLIVLFLLKNFKKYYSVIAKMILAGILARLVFVEVIRLFIEKSRPFVENKVNLIFNYPNTLSFPSGHASFYFAMSTVVLLYYKKAHPRPKFWWGAGLLFFIISFLISLSRVFVGIHWPSDILGGAVVGVISGIIILRLLPKK